MKDLFDEFMEELKRRQAAADGTRPPDPARAAADDPSRERRDAGDEARSESEGTAGEAGAEPADAAAGETDFDAGETDSDAGPEDAPSPGPTPMGPGRGGGRRRPPRRRRAAPAGERPGSGLGLVFGMAAIVLFAIFVLGGFVLDLWTDAIWFKSVGFDAVFWTRIGTQAALFGSVLVAAAIALLANVWIAGRLSPPPA